MNILMLSKSVFATDVRVRREAEALAGVGHRVTVVCLGPDESPNNGVDVKGLGRLRGLKVRGDSPNTAFHRAARWLLLPNHRRLSDREFADGVRRVVESTGVSPDVVHAHDFPALEAAAVLEGTERAGLVYDSHEYWRSVVRYGRPEPLGRARDRYRERRLAQRADAVITVSEGAAELLEEDLGVDRVHVVRNTFPINRDLSPPESPRGAVYAGRIATGRDLETVFSARVWSDSSMSLHLIGPNDDRLQAPAFAVTHAPAPLQAVDELLTSVGIALVPLIRGPKNHDIALPNKLFQAVSVGIPVVAANLPEMAKLVNRHRLGHLYEPGDADSLDFAIKETVASYRSLLESIRIAQEHLSWHSDRSTLVSLYESFAGQRENQS